MSVTRSMHVKAHLLDSVLNVRAHQREVLKTTNDGAVEGSVKRRRTLDGGHLSLRADRHRSKLAVKHAGSLEKIVGILQLMQEEASGPANNLDAEEVVESPQVLEGELGAEASCDLLKQRWRGRSQDDVVDIGEEVRGGSALVINKQGGIRLCGLEPLLLKEGRDPLVPGPRHLLQPVERTGEQAHMVRMVGVDETNRLLTEHLLVEVAMQKSIGHVELVNGPGVRNSELENSVNRVRFDNRGEGVDEVHAGALAKAAHDPMRLVALKGTVGASLVAVDPLASDDVGTGSPQDKGPVTPNMRDYPKETRRSHQG